MFKVNFRRALIISIVGHIFCFFAVVIVVMPAESRQYGFAKVSFLGSILDEASFKRDFTSSELHPRQGKAGSFFNSVKEKAVIERIKITAEKDYLSAIKPYKDSIGEVLKEDKHLAPHLQKELRISQAEASSEIEGQAKDRAIAFKPPLPDFRHLTSPSQLQGGADYVKIRLKLIIAANGDVVSVTKMESSGYPEIDLFAIRYVEKWRFSGLSPDRPQDDQEGLLTLTIKAW